MATLNLFRVETESLFRNLADYHEKLEDQIPLIQQSELEKIQLWAKQEAVDALDYYTALDEVQLNYQYSFPQSLRYSFIVLLFIVVEKQLTEFCRYIERKHKLPIRSNELKGGFIERAKIYSHKLAGISKDGVNWKNVEDLSVIRNCIVHTMGDVKDSRDKARIQQIASMNIGLSIGIKEFEDADTLQLTSEYCSRAVEDIQVFFDELFDTAGVGEKWVRTKKL